METSVGSVPGSGSGTTTGWDGGVGAGVTVSPSRSAISWQVWYPEEPSTMASAMVRSGSGKTPNGPGGIA